MRMGATGAFRLLRFNFLMGLRKPVVLLFVPDALKGEVTASLSGCASRDWHSLGGGSEICMVLVPEVEGSKNSNDKRLALFGLLFLFCLLF